MLEVYHHHACMDNPSYQAPKGRLLTTLILFLFILGLFYGAFLFFQKRGLSGDISDLGSAQVELESQIKSLKADQIQEVFVAQNLIDQVEANAIQWSKIIRELNTVTPVTIFFSSYTAGSNGEMQLSGLGDNYGSVADVIRDLEDSDAFQNVFVPSITLGSTSEGQSVVSFSLSLTSLDQ